MPYDNDFFIHTDNKTLTTNNKMKKKTTKAKRWKRNKQLKKHLHVQYMYVR